MTRIRWSAATLVLLAACSLSNIPDVNTHEVVGGTAPARDAVLASVEHADVAAWIAREAAAGRPVVLNFFASWCEPCREEMPLLLAVADEHPDVTFAGVDHLDLVADGRSFIEEFGVDFPTFHDVTGLTAAWVGGRGMPVTAFFATDGRLVQTISGPVTPAILDRELARLEAGLDG